MNGVENRFAGGGRCERHLAADFSEGGDCVANRFPDLPRKRRLERRGALGKLLDLRPRPFEGRFDVALRRPAPGRVLEPLPCPCDGGLVHGEGR